MMKNSEIVVKFVKEEITFHFSVRNAKNKYLSFLNNLKLCD